MTRLNAVREWIQSRRTIPASLHIECRGGDEETLVFIAGLGGTTRYWAPRLAPVEGQYRIVLVDLLGFGESPKPWLRYSVETHVQALSSTLNQLGPVTLIGHSLGALLAVAYAARHPDQVKNLVLIGMPNFGSQEEAFHYFRHGPVSAGYLYTNLTLVIVTCLVTRRVLGRLLPYVVRSVPREVAEDLVKHTLCSSTSSLWEVVYRYDPTPDLGSLPPDVGVTFIHGDRDLMAPLTAVERLVSQRPEWQLQVLGGVDHHAFLRQPEECLRLITGMVRPAP